MSEIPEPGAGLLSGLFGRRAFLAGAAGAAAGAALHEPGVVRAAEPAYSAFTVVTPTRLVDTRPDQGDFGYSRVNAQTIRVQVTGRTINGSTDTVPDDAVAAVFTLVGINRADQGNYLSAFPTGTAWPGTANLNMTGNGNVSPNLVTVKLGTDGKVDVLSFRPSDIVLDLVGVYRPTGGAAVREGRFRELSTVQRVLDTRNSGAAPGPGSVVRVDLTSLQARGLIDADAIAVVANVAATQTNRGFIAAYPFGSPNPGTSTLNVAQDDVRSIGTMVKLGVEDGRIGFNLFVQSGAHLIVDIAGYMTGPSASQSTTGQFVPVEPQRLLDTRKGVGGLKRLWPRWTRAIKLPSSFAGQAGAVAMNLAVTRTMGRGYFTVLGAQMRRAEVSNLNVTGPYQTLSNHAIAATSTLGIEVFSSAGGDVICDVVGWFRAGPGGPPQPQLSTAAVNPDPPAAPTPYQMDIPRLGLSRRVLDGDSDTVVNTGQVWHWSGTGLAGQGHAIATFAHRTDAGGPLRNIHFMGPGDQVAIFTGDQRKYTYEYVDRVLTTANPVEILGSTRFRNDETLAIVACTVGFDSRQAAFPDRWAPTSLLYRIVVRFRLVRWDDVIPVS